MLIEYTVIGPNPITSGAFNAQWHVLDKLAVVDIPKVGIKFSIKVDGKVYDHLNSDELYEVITWQELSEC